MRDKPIHPYERLRMQILLVLLCFGLVPLLAMWAAGLAATREDARTRMRNSLEGMVKNRKAIVELFLETTMRQLEFAAFAHSIDQLSNSEILESILNLMRRDRGAVVDLGLIADNGRHLAYAGPYNLQGFDYSDQPWFQQAMVLGRYTSDIFLGMRRFPHMVMAVKKRERGRDWILRATIDMDLLSALVREGGLESGADVFVLNRDGEYQTHYSDEHHLMEKADMGPVPLHSGVRIIEEDRQGGTELLATAWLRGDSWVLVTRQKVPGLALSAQRTAWLLALAFVVVPILSFVIARHRLEQFRTLEAECAALFESVAQSQKMAVSETKTS